MENQDRPIKKLKEFWNWIWNSDSILSWFVALILIYILIKFIFFPTLSFVMSTSLPLAGVESSSMDHQFVKDQLNRYNLCGENIKKEDKERLNFNEYWEVCGNWYENKNITRNEFNEFPLKNGFSKGDIVVVWGRFTPKIGDIIIFKPNPGSTAPRPIVHRIVEISKNENNQLTIGTKGDHNVDQLKSSNPYNTLRTDETNIQEDQVIGKVILKVPYLGWLKIFFVELTNKIMGR